MSTAEARLQRFTDVRVLGVLVAIVILGDVVTTSYGLSIGLPEGNPFVRGVLEKYGLFGMVGLKSIAVLWCVLIYKLLGRRYAVAALLGLAIPQGIAVVLNIITILQA